MDKAIKDFYLNVSQYTNAGAYLEYFKALPADINKLRDLLNDQHIHKMRFYRTHPYSLAKCNFNNINFLNDDLTTATSMTAEIFRLNPKGFVVGKPDAQKLIITCRYMSILFASVLKAKGIPVRCRAGFAPYIYRDYIVDHWINEYWSEDKQRWIKIDPDVRDHTRTCDQNVNLYDIGAEFEYSADLWLKARSGELENLNMYTKNSRFKNIDVFAWQLFLDFYALMNIELPYHASPEFIYRENFYTITKQDYEEIDRLAKFMQKPDENFELLKAEFENNEKFRILRSPNFNPYLDIK